MSDLSEHIEEVAQQPASIQGDAGSVTQRSLDELIRADKHLASVNPAAQPHLGLRFAKWRPPGTV